VDCIFGLEEFFDSGIREKGSKQLVKVLKHESAKGVGPWSNSMVTSRREPSIES
jgi:hypothetical protein